MKIPSSLRALLANSIDYAGLFPPATLQLEPALKNFGAYIRSDDAWMLSTFVLPIAKFAEAAWYFTEFNERHPLRVSALGPKTINETDFVEELHNVTKGIRQLSREGVNLVRVEQLEMPLPEKNDTNVFDAIGAVAQRSFWEAPAEEADRIIARLGEQNARGGSSSPGFKLRTGGVTADAFPTSAQIAHALIAAAEHRVPIKFTAGLHHPVRMFRDEVKTKMHGFLNVLGAGILAMEHGWDEDQTSAILEDEDVSAFIFNDDIFRWRDFAVSSEKIVQHRRVMTSFGSCSFDEPREDLRALNLL
jgi:hypothetical protein